MTPPASRGSPRPARRRAGGPGLLILLVLVLVVAALLVVKPWSPRRAKHDTVAATAANLRGVGHLERHEQREAEEAFGEAVQLAPDWLPFQINFGIALLRQQPADADRLARARRVFAGVLDRDPANKHAHYGLGLIALSANDHAVAHKHFAGVNKLDPDDPHTWLHLGVTHPDGPDSAAARECFERALHLAPLLTHARYNLAGARVGCGEPGKYGTPIGRDPKPPVGAVPMFERHGRVTLAGGARWAQTAELDPRRKAARERFGGAVVVFDYNRDGRPDVFLAHAVFENGKVRDLLLRNDGDNTFTDVTAAANLHAAHRTLGAAAADYDNDGHTDLVLTGVGEQRLYRNNGEGTFADVSAAAGLDKITDVCLGCGWVDIDQDGDLDLVLCKYAADTASAASFSPRGPYASGFAVLLENVGVAPPGTPPPGLGTAFAPAAQLAPRSAATTFLAADLDGDADPDLLLFGDHEQPVLVENDRLMRFKQSAPPWALDKPGRWNGGVVMDANHDERPDLFLVSADGPPTYLVSKGAKDFDRGATNAPKLRQAVAADIDLDGWCDVVAVTADGRAVLLHNQTDARLDLKTTAFGDAANAIGVGVADFDGDGTPDLLTWGDGGVEIRRNLGNGNRAVFVTPTGNRSNRNGVGAWLSLHSGSQWTGAERATATAGLGQSMTPTILGLGKASRADVLRVRWPCGIVQAELGVAAGPFRLDETNRRAAPRPILMAWNGERFAFVTDFLGGAALGETLPDGSVRPPRPEDSVAIGGQALIPKSGQYVLKIAEPTDAAAYLDRVQLVAADRPASSPVFPISARDHRGADVTNRVRERDRRAPDTFHVRSWPGFAEEHSLTLDFGVLPEGPARWQLVLAGWAEYPPPASVFAAARAGVTLQLPILERLTADGKAWESLGDLGFPAGLPRMLTRELEKFSPGGCVLRIRTNTQAFWDHVYLAPSADAAGAVTPLEPIRADLAARGFVQEVYPDGRPPVAYDDAKTEPVAVTNWKGKLTKLGDVTELLTADDDRFVVCGPGDEITVRFDATKLPPLKDGWRRSFVLKARGYCKGVSAATGGDVGPLPFWAMPNYPDFGKARPPATDAERWHTR